MLCDIDLISIYNTYGRTYSRNSGIFKSLEAIIINIKMITYFWTRFKSGKTASYFYSIVYN